MVPALYDPRQILSRRQRKQAGIGNLRAIQAAVTSLFRLAPLGFRPWIVITLYRTKVGRSGSKL
jgi:hypothetical protein